MRKGLCLFLGMSEERILSEAEKKFDRVRDQQEAEIKLAERGMTDQDFAKKMMEALKEPEIAFFFRVLIPCWLLYRANAQRFCLKRHDLAIEKHWKIY